MGQEQDSDKGTTEEPGAAQPPAQRPEHQPAKPPSQVKHDNWVKRWSKVWVPIFTAVAGFGIGLGPCATAYFQRDERNKVWEATYQDKARVLDTQSQVLKLQEEYLGKLKQIQEDQTALAKAEDALKQKEAEARTIQEQGRQALEALRARYANMEADERARIASQRASEAARVAAQRTADEAAERQYRWKDYGCDVRTEYNSKSKACTVEMWSVFAPDTPDAKVVVPRGTLCAGPSDSDGWTKAWSTATDRCQTYARSFLTPKGLTENDAKGILSQYVLVHSLGFKGQDAAADQEAEHQLRMRFRAGK